MARNRGDHRLAEHQAGDAHRPVALVTNAVVEVLEIRSGAEGTVGATQHGDFRVRIRIEATERFGECLRGGSVDGILHFGPVEDDGRHLVRCLDAHHDASPRVCC